MTARYTQTGGARLGGFNASWPFARLSATQEALQLSCMGRDYAFPRQSIRGLRRYRGIFSVGLRIEHNVASFPAFVVFWTSVFFWTSGFQRLKAQLESLGYEIKD
jgi:hypothetical protein